MNTDYLIEKIVPYVRTLLEKNTSQKAKIIKALIEGFMNLKLSGHKKIVFKDFIKYYNPDNRHERQESERFKKFTYEQLKNRDKTNLDIFWLKDESLENLENLPEPEIIAQEIAENLESTLEQFQNIIESLQQEK